MSTSGFRRPLDVPQADAGRLPSRAAPAMLTQPRRRRPRAPGGAPTRSCGDAVRPRVDRARRPVDVVAAQTAPPRTRGSSRRARRRSSASAVRPGIDPPHQRPRARRRPRPRPHPRRCRAARSEPTGSSGRRGSSRGSMRLTVVARRSRTTRPRRRRRSCSRPTRTVATHAPGARVEPRDRAGRGRRAHTPPPPTAIPGKPPLGQPSPSPRRSAQACRVGHLRRARGRRARSPRWSCATAPPPLPTQTAPAPAAMSLGMPRDREAPHDLVRGGVELRHGPLLGVQRPDRALADGDVARRRRRLRERREPARRAVERRRSRSPSTEPRSSLSRRQRDRGDRRPPRRRRRRPRPRRCAGCAGARRRRGGLRAEAERAPARRRSAPRRSRSARRCSFASAAPQHGVERRHAAAAAAVSCMCAHSVSASVRRRNGGAPARHSWSTQASAYSSLRPSTGSPRICSGAR